uniref:Defensin-like protein 1 n=1 Tax=Nicotiana sylvestris TaxID=4096 RepID=A0A1U7X773_NICSY|nr:PREDICTED: defensin-like protein 1 [Nicotiana sylvestris]
MAKSQVQCSALLALLFCFLIASTETQMAKAIGCKRYSTTWHGECLNSDGCNNQCIKWEGAIHGACHADGFLTAACFCYFC